MGVSRRGFIRGLGAGAVAPLAGALTAQAARGGDKPNIVFFLIDDLGWADLGCQGSRYYETPNIDRLATEGVRFTDAHTCAANCAPTRASLMSGKYTPRHGVFTVGDPWRGPHHARKLIPVPNNLTLSPDEITIAEALRAAGYVCAHMGKWHLGKPGVAGPIEQGFHLNVGGTHAGSPPGGYFLPNRLRLEGAKKGQYLTDYLTDRAVEFIEENKDRPFFLYLSHYAVHSPLQAKKDLIAKFRDKKPWHEQGNAVYAAMIASVDESVGRVLAKLEALGLADNTIVFFTSDNGGVGYQRTGLRHRGWTDNYPLRGGKGQFYEGGIRVPLIIRWPGVTKPGSTCDVPVITVDFYPTILEMARAKRPEGQKLDGESIVPLLKGSGGLRRKSIFWHFPCYLQASRGQLRTSPVSVIRRGDLKLLWFYEDDHVELYDLREDISEQRDLSKKFPEKAAELHRELKGWLRDVSAPRPKPNPAYRPTKTL